MIKCKALRTTDCGKLSRDWEVTTDGRVFPCCYFVNSYMRHMFSDDEKGEVELWRNDKKLMQKFKDNPNWNKFPENKFDDIINDDFWWNYVYTNGWNSDSPPLICKEECNEHEDYIKVVDQND